MFTAWNTSKRRTTLDIDFAGRYNNQIANLEKVMKDVCNILVTPDAIIFDSNTVKGEKIKEGADYEGIRLKFRGFLGRSRITMQVDVAFGDVIYPKPNSIDYPVILDFPRPRLRGYPAESIISEKFEAMIKLGLLNSRMKDFYDIWLMMRQFDFNGLRFAEALRRTFKHRKTPIPQDKPLFAEEIYNEESDRQILWKAFLRKGDIKQVPEKLSAVARTIEGFLITPLNAIKSEQAFDKNWNAPGPWK